MRIFLVSILSFILSATSLLAEDVAPERVPARVVRPIAERYDDAHRGFQCVPTLAVTGADRLWAAWYAGGTGEGNDNYVLVATSADGGATWSEPLFAIDPDGPVRAFDEILWTDPNGRLWLFWGQAVFQRSGIVQWEIHCDDPENGADAHWSEPRALYDGLILNKPIVDSKGRWLYPVQTPRGAAVYVSEDGGETVEYLATASTPPEELAGADEHCLIEKRDGSLWLYDRLRVPGIGQTYSTDGGKTWSAFEVNDWNNAVSRFFIRRLRSGALLLVKHGGLGEYCGRTNLKAFVSEDDGATRQGGLLLEPRFRCSYPDGDQTEDGTIYITYDRNRGLERELYCARFTEADVKAGKPVSDVCRLQVLIDKPTDAFQTWWESSCRHTGPDGKPGEYWTTEETIEAIRQIERGEREPVKNL